ncbi:MAG: histidine phosphatase family protein [Desulfarculales bacterium]|jgi:broad specificity phosphatase PhoE|nr:histidine phosphatase family protein [Desulfarculales bacterium]
MEIYLLRHGCSMANASNLVTGSKEDILCPEGREQARAASRLLHCFALDADDTTCFVSDWKRARETAALAAPTQSFCVDSRLGETDAGAAAEMDLDTFNRAYPAFWLSFTADRAYPGGESHADLYARVLNWRDEVENTLTPGAKVLAVTHAGPLCCLLHAACKVDMAHFPMFLAANASLSKLERVGAGSWRLAFFSFSYEMLV